MNYTDQAISDLLKAMARTSLSNFVSEITVKKSEIEQASKSYGYISEVLKTKAEEEKIPALIPYPTFLIGSYPRGTKISPLNDIDIFLVAHAFGTSYVKWSDGIHWFHGDVEKLKKFSQDGYTVSSVSVLNSIKKALEETYSSDISRNQQAVTVYLESYGITIDIVPAVRIKDEDFFIIPSGNGNPTWKFSHPLQDALLLDEIHLAHNNTIKQTLKIAKYWNREHNHNKLKSYHMEAAAYHIFGSFSNPTATILESCLTYFSQLTSYLYYCSDPTGMSEPISGYLSEDVLDRLNHEVRIMEVQNAAAKGSEEFIKFLRKEK